MEKELSFYISKFRNGDKSAFKDLYNQSYKAVYFHAYKIMKNEHDANDVLQSVYIKLYKKANQITDDDKLISWLFTVTENECKNLMRAQKKAPSSIDEDFDFLDNQAVFCSDDENPMEIADNEELNEQIKHILSGLSEEQQKVIIMYYYKQMNVSEIAYALNAPEGTIKSRLIYARKNMRRLIEKYENENRIKLHSASIIWLLADLNADLFAFPVAHTAVTLAATTAIAAVTVSSLNLPNLPPALSNISTPKADNSVVASVDEVPESDIKITVDENGTATADIPQNFTPVAEVHKKEKPALLEKNAQLLADAPDALYKSDEKIKSAPIEDKSEGEKAANRKNRLKANKTNLGKEKKPKDASPKQNRFDEENVEAPIDTEAPPEIIEPTKPQENEEILHVTSPPTTRLPDVEENAPKELPEIAPLGLAREKKLDVPKKEEKFIVH